MKRSATVTPSKLDEQRYEDPSQFQLVLEELRQTYEGVRRIEEKQTHTDVRMASFENKLIDIEAGSATIGTRITKMEEKIEEKIETDIGALDRKLSLI